MGKIDDVAWLQDAVAQVNIANGELEAIGWRMYRALQCIAAGRGKLSEVRGAIREWEQYHAPKE
ncbi:MAG: hypothetical protein JXA37_12990 [Chloroflexia bacterium]|nr:hypothetical protein [Chloroflexia bacterium]